MANETSIWVAPSLCGCTFRITGDFQTESVMQPDGTPTLIHGKPVMRSTVMAGTSYMHPTTGSITDIEIVTMCDEHKPFSERMAVDWQDLFDLDETGEFYRQTRGYLIYPIANPTPAECLYTYHYTCTGQRHVMPCGCSAYATATRDLKGNVDGESLRYHDEHPRHTKRCPRHHNDVGHAQALSELVVSDG